ncbi:MAG: hypothetical protein IT175_18350 [Acidobacteria bacterium]|nr:hypothetical protein [Acidobacteriota bacterium]
MNRIRYSDLLEEIRQRDLEVSQPRKLLEDAVVAPRRESRARLKVRLTAAQRAFLEDAAHSTRGTAIDEAAIVSVAIRILEELDVEWGSIATREDLVSTIRRALGARTSR